jgi:hypothetical protein
MPKSKRKTVLVLHLVGQIPIAGIAWQALHYVLGLRRLGFDAWYIEDSGAYPYDPRQQMVVADARYNVAYLKSVMEYFDLADRWAYWDSVTNEVHNISQERLTALYAEASALFNLCGATRLREEHLKCAIRIYVDTDPVFNQVKLASRDAVTLDYLGAHTHHFTYGENLGNTDCLVPMTGIDWQKTRPPVLVDLWATDVTAAGPFFTTIATWENRGKDAQIGNEIYSWSKHSNFLRFLDLPRHVPHSFRVALAPPNAEVEARVRACGWNIVDPAPISANIGSYRDFIVTSRGEFTVAKDIYVRPKSGWFSDRSVCYLAAGRPVITQETGFSKFIETGRGLFPFTSFGEITDALFQIDADYPRHAMGARDTARAFFGAEAVLTKIVETCGI